MNKQIHNMINESIFSETDPWEILPFGEYLLEDVQAILGDGEVDLSKFEGHNFNLKKMQQGDYANWLMGSGWATNSRPRLTDEQLAAIAEHGFHDLTKRLPDRPSEDEYEILTEMMEVSVNRQLTGENGVWRPEWEEAGFKPIRRKGGDGDGEGGESSGGGRTSGARRSTAASNAAKASGSANSDAMERLKNKHGKKSDDDVPFDTDGNADSPAAVAQAADDTPPATDVDEPSNDAMKAKIMARLGKKSA